jgi:RNA polymerase sigma-70 factor, ECF subfamily
VHPSTDLDTLSQMIAPAPLADAEPALPLLREGDLTALGQVYDLHHAAVRTFARRMIGEEAAEDLVHDTFLSLPKALARWNGDGALRSFIIGIAINHARHYVRARARRQRGLERLSQQPAPLPPHSPEESSEQRQLSELLLRALDSLSFEHRTTFVLCEVEERSSPEVAQILGIPENTVRTRLHHARLKLRAALGREGVR